ncbi:unnamed protein product [Lymnaea stagnalis]|uniref:GPI inositol-deacylase n=1 Tax=Lymnaea stagnalis TaxID=6523 RepID=A0AAV2HU06_LYMST
MMNLNIRSRSLALLVSLVTWTYGYHETLEPLPLKAHSVSGKDAAIIIIPETGVSHVDYAIYANIIQQLFPLRLYICMLDVSEEATLTLDNLPLLLAECSQELRKNGMKQDSDVFLAAHGHVGHLAADYAQAVPHTLRGLILLGTFLPRRFNVVSFPLPVLTLVGEIDGVTRITRVAQTLQAMIRSANFDPGLAVQSPLIILEGSNHEVFILDRLPSQLHTLDIESEVDKTDGMETAANMTALFLINVLQEPESLVNISVEAFRREFDKAQNLTAPIEILRQTTIDDFKSYWVKAAQKWLSGLVGKQSTQIEIDSYVERDPLPPTIMSEHGISYILTFSDVIRSTGGNSRGDDDGTAPQAPDEIAARMLGPERIQENLRTTSIARNYTCRDLNYASFMTAYHTASERARNRYDNYHRGVLFEPDVIVDSEELWETTRLELVTKATTLHVTSTSYRTPNDETLGLLSGLFFCKLLPPDRALEWIYVDSLRRELPAPKTIKKL